MFSYAVLGMFSTTMSFPIQSEFNSTNTFYNCSNISEFVSPFGCCNNSNTICVDSDCSNCEIVANVVPVFSNSEISKIEKDFMYDMVDIFRRFTNILMLGGCSGTQYGCCANTDIMCQDVECSNCVLRNRGTVGGCAGTEYGCCADGIKNCRDPHCMNCPISQQNDYILSQMRLARKFGSCPNTLINCIDKNCTNCRIYQTE